MKVVGEYPLDHYWSAEWTGRFHRYRTRRVSGAVWAKLYVWLRYEIKDRYCKLLGGHDFGWQFVCASCGMTGEEMQDHPRDLREALRCRMVVI